jgi:hypothetical protein
MKKLLAGLAILVWICGCAMTPEKQEKFWRDFGKGVNAIGQAMGQTLQEMKRQNYELDRQRYPFHNPRSQQRSVIIYKW